MGNVVITTNPAGNIMSGMSLNSTYSRTPLEKYSFELQSKIDREWSMASDLYDIEEEYPFASGSFIPVQVRINHEVVSDTSEKLGDDYKSLIFKDLNHVRGMGYLYSFNQNLWLTINTDFTKSLTASTTIRRANNFLRWIDVTSGSYMQEACIIDYQMSRTQNKISTSDPVIPQGLITVYCQLNNETRTIKPNQRFLFGNTSNWVSYKVQGGGVQNFLNVNTFDNNSAQLLELKMEVYEGNPDTDNLVLGVADYFKYTNSGSVSGNIVVTPTNFDILTGGSQTYNVLYYFGSSPTSASFVFSISDNLVPVSYYILNSIDGNNFSVLNNHEFFDSSLNILATSISGSRIIPINLGGEW